MEEEQNVDETTKNEQVVEETTVEEQAEETPNLTSEEEVAELRKKAELADNYKIRAEKAEKKAKATSKEPVEQVQQNQMGAKDYLALSEHGVNSEDFDEVTRVAKILNKPLTEALKDKTMQSIIAERVDERRTANATQTKGGSRGSVKTTGEDLLQKAERTGEVPDTDAGMTALAEARLARLAKKN